jgi:hypothetical protein
MGSDRSRVTAQSDTSADTHMMDPAETRMRLALGLGGPGAARPQARFAPDQRKRRFVQDGEVPVTLVSRAADHVTETGQRQTAAEPVNRLEVAENALFAERGRRADLERQLAEAQGTITHLETRLGHSELTLRELREAARRDGEDALREANAARDAALAALAEERARREAAEAALARRASAPAPAEVAEPMTARPRTRRAADTAAGPKPKRVPRARAPKPVKWWIKKTGD